MLRNVRIAVNLMFQLSVFHVCRIDFAVFSVGLFYRMACINISNKQQQQQQQFMGKKLLVS
jgi:hypothetical protein